MLIARSSLPENIVNNIKTRIILIIAKIGKMANGESFYKLGVRSDFLNSELLPLDICL